MGRRLHERYLSKNLCSIAIIELIYHNVTYDFDFFMKKMLPMIMGVKMEERSTWTILLLEMVGEAILNP